MTPDEAHRVSALFAAIAAARRPLVGLENTLRHRDGSLVVVETTGVPIFGADGEYRGYRGMDRNVSERKRLEEQLRQAQKLEAIGQLAGGVAHDFNNILAAAMMHLGLMQANPDLDAETQAGLKELEHETERAASLTRQLLMFSRRSLLDVRRLDLNELVTNLLKMLRRLIGEHIDLRFDTRGAPATVDGDVGMLEQVLVNLVVNARDSMPGGGRISIGSEVVTVRREQLPARDGRQEGRFVCLSVTDTGSGMERQTLERIFEPFFTTKEAGKGTGLGLAVVHGIVGQHRGWIEVESEVGRGTTFRLFLPQGPGRPEETPESREKKSVRGGKETVLLVEDDKALRRLVTKLLTSLGYRVLEADNGQQALATWRQHGAEIDLLFTDMVMPEGMTGRELYERLHAERPGLRTIISSGYSPDPIQVTREGMLYLPKPYNMTTLAHVVRCCLEGS
jgi:two-component system, cell cycle sensor histidine kinase and response regulator CckA